MYISIRYARCKIIKSTGVPVRDWVEGVGIKVTVDELTELIARGESLTVEFKGEANRQLSDDEIVEAVVCMANRPAGQRGWVLVGVEDDGRITGVRPRYGSGTIDPLRVQALISTHTQPTLSCRVDVIMVNGKPVLVIEVPRAERPIATSSGVYKRRAIGGRGVPQCLPYHFHEMQANMGTLGLLDFSAQPVRGARWDDLDPLEFERYRRFIRESKGFGDRVLLDLPDIELAKVLGVVDADHEQEITIRVAGLLLFGREESLRRFLPTHEVAFQVLSGTSVEANDFMRWPLLRVMDEVMTRFRARYREEELMVGLIRVGVPEYSERAFREAIANAIIHRDYTRMGAVHIQWYDDRIEISNPGGFPEGVRLDNLLVTPPRPRNPLLADVFKRAGIVERIARGIDTIFYEQLRNGRPAPSYERSTDTDVVLVIPGGKGNLNFVRLAIEENVSLDGLLILNQLWRERRITTDEVARLIQKGESDARSTLERLVEMGLVEARGEKKGRVYHLSAATYRRLGEGAAYVRVRGFEPLQMEQMIMQYVRAHGRITRRDAAALCQISPRQARYLLQKMVEKGKMIRKGKGRASYYQIARNGQ